MTTEASALFDVSKVCRDLEHVKRGLPEQIVRLDTGVIRVKEYEGPYLTVGTAFFQGITRRSKLD